MGPPIGGYRGRVNRNSHARRSGWLLATVAIVLLGACSLNDPETPGGETERFLLDDVPGLEREPNGLNAGGALTDEKLLKLGFSRDQARMFEDSEAIGFGRVWVNDDDTSYVRTVVFQLPSDAEAATFVEGFLADAVEKGAKAAEVPGVEGATTYRYEINGGFNVTLFQRGDLAFAIAGNDEVAGTEAVAPLARGQLDQAPGAKGRGDDDGGAGAIRWVLGAVAALLAAGVLVFGLRIRRDYET